MSDESSVVCIIRFRLKAGDKAFLVHGNSDGSWIVSESTHRLLAAADTPHTQPTTVEKFGHSDSPAQIEADVMAWAKGKYRTPVEKESL